MKRKGPLRFLEKKEEKNSLCPKISVADLVQLIFLSQNKCRQFSTTYFGTEGVDLFVFLLLLIRQPLELFGISTNFNPELHDHNYHRDGRGSAGFQKFHLENLHQENLVRVTTWSSPQ